MTPAFRLEEACWPPATTRSPAPRSSIGSSRKPGELLSDPPVRSLREVYDAGRYHCDLDLMDAIITGPDQPE